LLDDEGFWKTSFDEKSDDNRVLRIVIRYGNNYPADQQGFLDIFFKRVFPSVHQESTLKSIVETACKYVNLHALTYVSRNEGIREFLQAFLKSEDFLTMLFLENLNSAVQDWGLQMIHSMRSHSDGSILLTALEANTIPSRAIALRILRRAVFEGNEDTDAISKQLSEVRKKGNTGFSLLCKADYTGIEIGRIRQRCIQLLDKKVLTQPNLIGETPLMLLYFQEDWLSLRLMLEKGCTVPAAVLWERMDHLAYWSLILSPQRIFPKNPDEMYSTEILGRIVAQMSSNLLLEYEMKQEEKLAEPSLVNNSQL
jgi:hypothetical protein